MAVSKKLVADFETTTDINDCRVWATCIYDIYEQKIVHVSNNLYDFMEVLRQSSKNHSLEIYFHNLKFDGEFILWWLYFNGFIYDESLSRANTFRTLITDTGLFYELEIRFYKKGASKIVTVRDSLKLIPLKVEQMAKAFGLNTLKGSIDYDRFREKGHKLTREEIEYIKNDVVIVGDSLKAMFDMGLTKMTISSNALEDYKWSVGGSVKFRNLFPKLNKQDDAFIRESYRGGYTYANPNIAGKHIKENGMTFDVNSLYPSRMAYELLPYDMPIWFNGKYAENEFYPLYVQCIKCKFKLKKGYVPTIQIKHNSRFNDHEYLVESGAERVKLYLTNIDLEIFFEHYDVSNISWLGGYMFKGAYNLFKRYIDKWMRVKHEAERTGNKGLRQIAKLMLNSLYGKFATNGVSDVKIPIMNNENIVKQHSKCTIDKETFNGVLKEDKERELNYTAMACFITAYARRVTIKAIMDLGGINKGSRFCYADTDSVHITGEEMPNLWIHKTELGAWKHESNWCYAKFIRAKCYMEEIIGNKVIKDGEEIFKESLDFNNYNSTKLDVKCAGMPDNVKYLVTKKNFKIGFTVRAVDNSIDKKYKKITPKKCVGGVVLVPTDFTIKE